MQSAGQRTLSTLASKLHPPLTLTPHESRQLLQLLTQSFRTHLDREHPVDRAKNNINSWSYASKKRKDRIPSSHRLAADHLDSILANPLLARQPPRPESNLAVADVIRDPLGWFLDQVALGTATLRKATTCAHLLKANIERRESGSTLPKHNEAATPIAEWLRTSQMETSREFVEQMTSTRSDEILLPSLVPLLLDEGNQTPLWRWLTRPIAQRIEETGLDMAQVEQFQKRLLACMVTSAHYINFDMALTIFLRAHRMVQKEGPGLAPTMLGPSGAAMVNRIVEDPHLVTVDRCSLNLYDSFLLSTSEWLSSWSKAVQAMLYLYHPSKPTAQPGLAFIKDPAGAERFVRSSKSKRHFLVRLCLGVAHQLVAEAQFAEAEVAMDFAQEHFADILLTRTAEKLPIASIRTEEEEQRNLEMLDRLLLT